MREPSNGPFDQDGADTRRVADAQLTGDGAQRQTLSDDASVGRKFQLLSKLAERSHVVIYDAEHTGIGRKVELHMLPLGLSADSPQAHRLVHAARAGARVAHPHIRSVVDSGVDTQGRPFIVYEHVYGMTVAEFMRSHPDGLDLRVAAELICQLLEALSCAHAGGVVHRNVNADNVVLAGADLESLRLKLGGFELAHLQHRPDGALELPRGYSPFFAPEFRRGDDTSGVAIDVFAVGVMLRLLATGDARRGKPMPDVVGRAVDQATADDPDERFRSADQFLAAVNLLVSKQDHPGVSILPPGDPTASSLTADLRYLKRRREGSTHIRDTQDPTEDLELLGVLLVIEALYARLGDEGWGELARGVPRVVDLLPDSERADQYAADGVPCNLLAQVLEEADRICGDGLLSLLGPLGESVAARALPRLCPELPEALAPEVLVSAVPALWRALCRSGEVHVLECDGESARIAIGNQSTPTLELTGVFGGLLLGALRAHGALGAQVNIASSQALGDAADIYTLSW